MNASTLNLSVHSGSIPERRKESLYAVLFFIFLLLSRAAFILIGKKKKKQKPTLLAGRKAELLSISLSLEPRCCCRGRSTVSAVGVDAARFWPCGTKLFPATRLGTVWKQPPHTLLRLSLHNCAQQVEKKHYITVLNLVSNLSLVILINAQLVCTFYGNLGSPVRSLIQVLILFEVRRETWIHDKY